MDNWFSSIFGDFDLNSKNQNKMKFLLYCLFLPTVFSTRNFFIGTATSSYQIEGSNVGESIWDRYTSTHHLHPVGNATQFYDRYHDDIKMMYDLGFRHFRLSISWTRIMPFEYGILNQEGIQFYHNVIDTCLSYNITPYVTLYHWDLPQYIDEQYDGWLHESIVPLFLEYSKLMFQEFGSKVKHWMTINEPLTTSNQGYGQACNFAPGKCSDKNRYTSARNQLLAHATVGNYYKKHYDGDIGIVLNSNWIEPMNPQSRYHAKFQMDDSLGLFLQPLLDGNFPSSIEHRITPFSAHQKEMMKDSYTFIGINHYTTYIVNELGEISTSPDWFQAQSTWLYDAPRGISELMYYLRDDYHVEFPILITECGFSQKNDGLVDLERVHYLSGYINQVLECIRNGMTNIEGFFVWSLLDNFEWSSGYNETFGIVHVDFEKNYQRTPKLSARFIKEYLNNFINYRRV
jgi:beta-glucosidase/6-phospho-beta-glucosidase/beta-galactosidase